MMAANTQNIDNLHQDSGVPAEQVIEIHGNTLYARCLDCGARAELDFIRPFFEAHGHPPDCPECGGILKTATISFGQTMPEGPMRAAEEASSPAMRFSCSVPRSSSIRRQGL